MKEKALLIVLLILIISSCASQKSMYKKASEINSIDAYKEFLTKYPEGEFSENAGEQIIALEFGNAEKQNSIESFSQFLRKYPDCKFSKSAQEKLISLEFKFAKEQYSVESFKKFLEKYPDSKFSDEAKRQIRILEFKAVCSEVIELDGIKIRTETFRMVNDFLLVKLNYDTGGKDLQLVDSDFTLVDSENQEYMCEGFHSEIQPAGLIFSGLRVMTRGWQEDSEISAVFHKVVTKGKILCLKYKGLYHMNLNL